MAMNRKTWRIIADTVLLSAKRIGGRAARERVFLGLNVPEWLYVLFCFVVCVAGSIAFVQKAYGPDEWMRIMVPEYIARYGVIPTGTEPELLNDVWGFSYALQMKLPYLLGGLNLRIAQKIGEGAALLPAARLVSCLSMAGVAVYAIRLTKKITASPCRWIFIALLTLTPQSLFLGTYFNLDAYSLFAVLMIVDSWAEGIRSRWSLKSCAYLGLSMGLCVLGYEYAYGFLIASVLLYVGWFLMHRREQRFGRFFGHGCCVAAVFLLLCGWYFVRNGLLFPGDIFAYRVQNVYCELFARDELKPSLRLTLQRQGLSIWGMLHRTEWIRSTAASTFGMLGYMDILLPSWMYRTYALAVSVGCGAFLVLKPQQGIARDPRGELWLFAAALLLGAAINVGLSVYASWARDYQPQGRYILYALIPAYMATALGWRKIAERLASWRKIDPRIPQWILTGSLIAFFTIADLTGLIRLLELYIWMQ